MIAAMDLFTVPTATFRVLYVFFVIHHERRQILHFSVSANPGSDFVIQQLREAFPYDTAPRYLILDRDTKFSKKVRGVIDSMGIQAKQTAYKSPWQNGVAERWVGSVRRELLNHVIVLNEAHLRRLLKEYVAYYNADRTHLTLEKDTPAVRLITPKLDDKAHVISLPRVGGLHHRYIWSEVA
jgi:transposase InsO family protein